MRGRAVASLGRRTRAQTRRVASFGEPVTDAPALNEDFLDMLTALQGAGVEVVIVGAHALSAHGFPRATGDLDLFVRPTPENAARVIAALHSFGAPLDAHGISQVDFEKPGTIYQIGLPPRRIDILTEISGVSFEEAWSSRMQGELGGHR